MRIISKFHDYYDIGMQYGQDQTLIYHRTPTETLVKKVTWGNEPGIFEKNCSPYDNCLSISYQRFVVGFCGKAYLCYRLEAVVEGAPYKQIMYAYCAEAVRRFAEIFMEKHCYVQYMGKASPYSWMHTFKHVNVEKRFEKFDQMAFEDYFINNKVVLFTAIKSTSHERHRRYTIEVLHDANLKDVQFYRVFDSFSAYQEIAMFLGGVLGVGEPHIIDVSDECKRDGKGFNDQSFKTRKGTKPKRKNKKKK